LIIKNETIINYYYLLYQVVISAM